jgi:amidase
MKRTNGIVERLSISPNKAGPLSGKTFVVKDLFDVKGRATGAGNPDWQSKHKAASKNASVVETLLDAGATLEGVSCSDEFAFSINGINIHYGTPVNPQFEDRIPGGSSSGSASAVAAGIVDFALGTDTAGSVRVPASFCGIYGIRPTQGRLSTEGVLPLSTSIDAPGWFARDPSTFRLCGQVLLAHSLTQPVSKNEQQSLPQRLLLATDAFKLLDEELADQMLKSLAMVKDLFSDIQEIDLSTLHWETFPDHLNSIRGWECTQYYGQWMAENNPNMAADIKARFAASAAVTKEQHDSSLAFANDLTKQFDQLLGDYTVLCLPTVCNLPSRIDASADDLLKSRGNNLRLTALASVARLPQVSVPIPLPIGCKFGLSFVANQNRDMMLLNFCDHPNGLKKLIQS